MKVARRTLLALVFFTFCVCAYGTSLTTHTHIALLYHLFECVCVLLCPHASYSILFEEEKTPAESLLPPLFVRLEMCKSLRAPSNFPFTFSLFPGSLSFSLSLLLAGRLSVHVLLSARHGARV